MKGKDLIFISRVIRDGSGTEPVDKEYKEFMKNEDFRMSRLSITKDTYIASGMNCFVVKVRSQAKKKLKL